jgi:hypothetical protein
MAQATRCRRPSMPGDIPVPAASVKTKEYSHAAGCGGPCLSGNSGTGGVPAPVVYSQKRPCWARFSSSRKLSPFM